MLRSRNVDVSTLMQFHVDNHGRTKKRTYLCSGKRGKGRRLKAEGRRKTRKKGNALKAGKKKKGETLVKAERITYICNEIVSTWKYNHIHKPSNTN